MSSSLDLLDSVLMGLRKPWERRAARIAIALEPRQIQPQAPQGCVDGRRWMGDVQLQPKPTAVDRGSRHGRSLLVTYQLVGRRR